MRIGLLIAMAVLLASPLRAQNPSNPVVGGHKFGIIAKAGAAIPVGEFSDLFTTGFAGYVEVPYDLSAALQVFAGVGYTRFTVDAEKLNNELAAAGIPGTATLDAPYRVIPVLAGLKFFSNYGKLWPYFSFSFGLYAQELKTSGTLVNGDTVTVIGPTTDTWSQGAFGVGIGTMIELGKRWAIDVDSKFNSVIDYDARVLIGTSGSENVSTRAIKFASVLAGLSYKF
jgi:opacity protein-like surface antigen